jgi:hypothetical protein
MKDSIDRNIEYLSQLTQEEADLIEYVLNWNDDQTAAFKIAKMVFEEYMQNDYKSKAE